MKFQVNFTNDILLIYNLDTTISLLNNWITEISQMNVMDLCPINHKTSTGNKLLIKERINRLYELADILNTVIPNSIVKESLTEPNYQEALNRMHVHFPNIHKMHYNGELPLDKIASEYNDIIHWIEHEYDQTGTLKFKIYLDFNKSGKTTLQKIKEEDFLKFKPFTQFGDLSLHYVHVGRHSAEIFNRKDFECPKDQFIPQTSFSASSIMWFHIFPGYFDKTRLDSLLARWKKFYYERGGKEFFGVDIDDPKIAFGYLPIGKLDKVIVGEKHLKFQTFAETEYIRSLLIKNNIENFYVVDKE